MSEFQFGPGQIDKLLADHMRIDRDGLEPRSEPMGVGLMCLVWFLLGAVTGCIICMGILIAGTK